MKRFFAIGIILTFIIGLGMSKIFPVQVGYRGNWDMEMLCFMALLAATELYFTLVLWKYMKHRIWVKIILILFIIVLSPVVGFLITSLLIKPFIIHVPILYDIIDNWEYNTHWFFAHGVSLAILGLYLFVNLFVKIVRG